ARRPLSEPRCRGEGPRPAEDARAGWQHRRSMTVFDYTVLAIVVLSIVISVIRGLLREVLALAAWAIGFIVASVFAADAAALLAPQVPDERVRLLVAFSGVFLAVLLGMSLLAMLLSRLAQS